MEKKVRAHVVISGRVQGVFFRSEARRAAHRFGVHGWVRNEPDGTVEAILEGEQKQIEAMLEWCRKGPDLAEVIDVAIEWENYQGEFQRFDITF
jgi:acylphosphatase